MEGEHETNPMNLCFVDGTFATKIDIKNIDFVGLL